MISPHIFRAYDIRGIVPEELNATCAKRIAKAYATLAIDEGESAVVLGRDGRLSSPAIAEAVRDGLLESGMDVIDIGLVPSPVLYFANQILPSRSGIMITGSHNPANYNGLKMSMAGSTLSADRIQELRLRVESEKMYSGNGTVSYEEVSDQYIARIVNDIRLNKRLKVVIDCGNGASGHIAERLFQAMNCELISLYTDIDGSFPHHHPDPSEAENLRDLRATVLSTSADLGFAFDGDGDRLGLVTNTGEIIPADRFLMLLAQAVLREDKGAKIIYDVKCSRVLADIIQQEGGQPILCQTGHSLVKAALKRENAALAGEMSGHVFFKHRWYGFDDALYTACRILETVACADSSLADLMRVFPSSTATPELKLPITDDKKFDFMEKFKSRAEFPNANIITIDGVRVEYENAWGSLRPSNTTPNLVLRFEADNPDALAWIKSQFQTQIQRIDEALELA